MILLPLRLIGSDEFDLFVVLQDENLARIRAYDPAEIPRKNLGEPWASLKMRNVVIAYATPDEVETVTEMCNAGKVREALKMLARGFRYRPDRGDSDEPSQSALTPAGPRKE